MFCSYSGSTLTKLVATICSGIAIGLTATALQLAVDVASRRRNALLDRLLAARPPGGAGASSLGTSGGLGGLSFFAGSLLRYFGALAGLSAGAVLLLTLVVALWAPKAAGGGVALVMAFLNGACARRLRIHERPPRIHHCSSSRSRACHPRRLVASGNRPPHSPAAPTLLQGMRSRACLAGRSM